MLWSLCFPHFVLDINLSVYILLAQCAVTNRHLNHIDFCFSHPGSWDLIRGQLLCEGEKRRTQEKGC